MEEWLFCQRTELSVASTTQAFLPPHSYMILNLEESLGPKPELVKA